MDQKTELRTRVTAKKKELEARLATLQADAGAKAREESKRVKARLADLQSSMKEGWDELTEDVAAKLNRWLTDDDDDDVRA